MFGLGMPEILLILAIALMVIGPKKLPELAKTLGKAMGEFKNAAQDFKRSIDLESTTREFSEPVNSIKDDIKRSVTVDDAPSNDFKADDSTQDLRKNEQKGQGAEKTGAKNADADVDADFDDAPYDLNASDQATSSSAKEKGGKAE